MPSASSWINDNSVNSNDDTVLSNSTVVVLLCGLPGSGKTTFALELKKELMSIHNSANSTNSTTIASVCHIEYDKIALQIQEKLSSRAATTKVTVRETTATAVKESNDNNGNNNNNTNYGHSDDGNFECDENSEISKATSPLIEIINEIKTKDSGNSNNNDGKDNYSDKDMVNSCDTDGGYYDYNHDDWSLLAWRESRVQALELLKSNLQQQQQYSQQRQRQQKQHQQGACNDHGINIIIVDDNFHLRSMRRQIYRICQEVATKKRDLNGTAAFGDAPDTCSPRTPAKAATSSKNDENKNAKIYFVILWMDTPKEVCIRNNIVRKKQQHRHSNGNNDHDIDYLDDNKAVPEHILHKMHKTFEPPGKAWWEKGVVKVSAFPSSSLLKDNNAHKSEGNTVQITADASAEDSASAAAPLAIKTKKPNIETSPSIEKIISSLLLVNKTECPLHTVHYLPNYEDTTTRLQEERYKTKESFLHACDQMLRKWISCIASLQFHQQPQQRKDDMKKINEIRKIILKQLKQQQQHQKQRHHQAHTQLQSHNVDIIKSCNMNDGKRGDDNNTPMIFYYDTSCISDAEDSTSRSNNNNIDPTKKNGSEISVTTSDDWKVRLMEWFIEEIIETIALVDCQKDQLIHAIKNVK